MSEERFDQSSVRRMSDDDIKRAFDELVEAWEDLQEAEEARDEFDREHRPPDKPAMPIRSVEALIEYDRREWRYQERLERVAATVAERAADFARRAGVVGLLLPEIGILAHTYRGDRPELGGRTYKITHSPQRGRRRGPYGNPGGITVERIEVVP